MTREFNSGERVRLLSDPGRIGVVTDKIRERRGKKHYFIQFPDSSSWLSSDVIEAIDGAADDIYALLEQKKFGRVTDFRRNLTYIQLSGKLANIVYSMDTTNTEFYAYQYKPVLSFLEAPSKGILIADEVGLGKTIEAGLIWTELRARFDSRRLLIVCPAMLREKWKSELAYRFGIEANIVSASELTEELKRSRHQVPPGRALICSYDSIRPSRSKAEDGDKLSNRDKLTQMFEDNSADDPLFDLIIFDEAHKMRNPESATAKLGHLLREVSEHVILLSATPINLKSEDLFHLLNIVDQETFGNEWVFPSILKANQPLIEAQKMALDRSSSIGSVKQKLEQAQHHYLLKSNSQIKNILSLDVKEIDETSDSFRIELANRIEKINLLSKVVTRTRKSEVKEFRVIREPFAPQIQMSDLEANLYQTVTDVVRHYAWELDVSDGFLLATPQRQLSSSMYAALKSWKGRQSAYEAKEQSFEDFGQEKESSDSAPLMQRIMYEIDGKFSLEELYDSDTKFLALLKALNDYFNATPDEKIIIFSYFRGTIDYLSERLKECGFDNEILMGGMKESKQSIIDRFKNSNNKQVLLASEVASEGVDLQFCRVLINYDLPWNPMKIEQRIGRIDRHGQKAEKINILNFCYNDTIDQRIYEKLFVRLNIFESALGDMEAILGEEIAELTKELLSGRLSKQQEEARIEQTSLAIEKLKKSEQELEAQASNLIAHSGHILQEVNAAHEFNKRVTELDLSIYVKDFLQRHCQGFEFYQQESGKLVFDIKLPASLAAELKSYISSNKLYGITQLDNGQKTSCLFENNVATKTPGYEKINQTHPLIQFIGKKLKEIDEAFIPIVSASIERDTNSDIPSGVYVAVIKKMSFMGLRIEEELVGHIYALDSDLNFGADDTLNIANQIRLKGIDWPEAGLTIDTNIVAERVDECEDIITDKYSEKASQKEAENNDRLQLQLESAKKHFERQLDAQNRTLNTLSERGLTGLIKATEGKIRKIHERYEQRIAELNALQEFKHRIEDVCSLLVKVN